MEIKISDQTFIFEDASEVKVEAGGYDLYIQEQGFDKTTEKLEHQFTSKPIALPWLIAGKITRTSLGPCSKIFIDSKGKKRLYTYFD